MTPLTRKISNHFRSQRDANIKALIASAPRRDEYLRIIDIGGSMSYWQRLGIDFLRAHKVKIDLLNLLDDELHRDVDDFEIFSFIVGDARATGLSDMSYDICHSNSVIEHVGLWWDFESFANETRRLAPSYYVQTPNFWFPIEPHFWRLPLFHWLPRPIRIRLFQYLPLATVGRAPDYRTACYFADRARLLNRPQMKCLFPDSDLLPERIIFFNKSYIAIRHSKN
jgi:hypothetical protein